jgi:hypothetical protein
LLLAMFLIRGLTESGSVSRHFSESGSNPDPDQDKGFLGQRKNVGQKLSCMASYASTKDIQAPGEASRIPNPDPVTI